MAERKPAKTMRERPTLFRRTDEAVRELEQQDSPIAGQSDSGTAKPPRIKATFYLNADDIVAIDVMQTKEFQKTGKKAERSELVSRAIQLLRQQGAEPAGQQNGT